MFMVQVMEIWHGQFVLVVLFVYYCSNLIFFIITDRAPLCAPFLKIVWLFMSSVTQNCTCTLQNVPIGYWVVQVSAEDKDYGANGQVEFAFVTTSPGNTDWQKFQIDQYGGNVTTKAHIDREEQEVYYVSISGK